MPTAVRWAGFAHRVFGRGINTGTTIVTFLMVFLIQSSQNRDSCAIHLKLDEIIDALKHANDELMDLEGLDQKELDKIRHEYARRAEIA